LRKGTARSLFEGTFVGFVLIVAFAQHTQLAYSHTVRLLEEIMRMQKAVLRTNSKSRANSKTSSTVGQRIIEGLEEAVAWSKGADIPVRVTKVQVPDVDVSKVRKRMGLSQAQFATKFGFSPATLRNWEQGRVRPDTPTRVLLAVIAKHPESVEDVLHDM
jgi:putative transcriptional regulator